MLKNSGKIKLFDYCGACTFYLGAVIVTLVCQALAGIVSAALSSVVPDIGTNGDFLTAFMIVIQLANVAFILLFCKLNGYRFDCGIAKSRTENRFDFRDVVIPVAAAFVLLLGMYLPTVWYGYFTRYALRIPPSTGNINLNTASSVVMIVIASVFLAPVCEESIYRGVLYNGLASRKSALKAVLLSALAFMLMHMSPIQVVFQFSLGVLSAFVMKRTNRLLPCVVLHAVANALALAIQFPPFSGGINGAVQWLVSNPASATFITLGLLAAGGGLLFLLVRFGYGKPVSEDTEAMDQAAPQPATAAEKAVAGTRGSDGTMRYYIALGICFVMFVINLITEIAS